MPLSFELCRRYVEACRDGSRPLDEVGNSVSAYSEARPITAAKMFSSKDGEGTRHHGGAVTTRPRRRGDRVGSLVLYPLMSACVPGFQTPARSQSLQRRSRIGAERYGVITNADAHAGQAARASSVTVGRVAASAIALSLVHALPRPIPITLDRRAML